MARRKRPKTWPGKKKCKVPHGGRLTPARIRRYARCRGWSYEGARRAARNARGARQQYASIRAARNRRLRAAGLKVPGRRRR